MLVQVAAAGALVTAGAVLGIFTQRFRCARGTASAAFTRRTTPAEPNTLASWLVPSLLPDPQDGGPPGPASELKILLTPDRPGKPGK